jgi:hypothetical protein
MRDSNIQVPLDVWADPGDESMEGFTPQQELYDEKYQPDDNAGIGDEEQEEYDELWADELREIAAPEIPPPPRVSLKDFPQLKHLIIGDHTLCYLARVQETARAALTQNL